jgi:hypothetical protein
MGPARASQKKHGLAITAVRSSEGGSLETAETETASHFTAQFPLYPSTMLAKRGVAATGRRLFSSTLADRDVVVVSIARTPIGKIGGALSSLTAPKLGAHAIAAAVERANIPGTAVEEAFIGNVVSANIGQAPARQAAIYAGLGLDTACTTVNKVCASGMKAVMLSSLSISSGYRSVCVAGGMEVRVLYI